MTNDTDQKIQDLEQKVSNLESELRQVSVRPLPFDGEQLDPHTDLILKRNVVKIVSGIVFGDSAATAANYGVFLVADRAYEILSISESHRVIGSDGGTVTVSVEKCATGIAPNSGVDLLATALSLKATANTPQFGTLTTTKADLLLKRGDRLLLKDVGTLTSVSDVCLTVILRER